VHIEKLHAAPEVKPSQGTRALTKETCGKTGGGCCIRPAYFIDMSIVHRLSESPFVDTAYWTLAEVCIHKQNRAFSNPPPLKLDPTPHDAMRNYFTDSRQLARAGTVHTQHTSRGTSSPFDGVRVGSVPPELG